MNFPQIQIETTKGFLHIHSTKPVQEIRQPRATLMQNQPAAILEMSTAKPQLTIDTTEARAELDLKGPLRRTREHAQRGRQALLEGIARRASEGRQMMEIEHGIPNVFGKIAKQNEVRSYKSLGIRFVGNKDGVRVHIQPGSLDIRFTPQQARNDVQINKPIHNYRPGQVSTRVDPLPSIRIDVKW